MKNKFRFLSYGCFHIETSKGLHILIDPYLDDNPHIDVKSDSFERVDLLLVSHGPIDHVGDTAKIAKKHGCKVICTDEVYYMMLEEGVAPEQLIKVCWGLATIQGDIRIKIIENHHRSLIKLKSGHFAYSTPASFIITLEDGTRVYNAGDTALFSDMKLQGELYRPHIGLINVSADYEMDPNFVCGEMSPYEAALASQWLGLEVAIACHYAIPPKQDQCVMEFMDIMKSMAANAVSPVHAVAPELGEIFEYSWKEGFEINK